MIIVSRIIHVKVDRRLNVANKFKYQRRLSSRLATVMFRGTPCTYLVHQTGWYEETKFLPIRIIQQYYLCVLCLETCVPREAVKGVFLIFLPQQLRKKYIEIILLYYESRLYHKVGNSRCAPTCGKCRHLR